MITAVEAAFLLDQRLVERYSRGLPAHVEQIDAVLAEDATTVVNYVYFAGCPDDDCLVISYDLPAPVTSFDAKAAASRLLCSDSVMVH